MKETGGLDYGALEILCASEDDFSCFRMLPGEHDGNRGLQDASFFGCDFAKGVAQEIFVVEIEAGDDGNDRVKNVSGIEAAAEADFEDTKFDALTSERFECHGGDAFEIGGMRAEFSIGEEFFDQDVNAREDFREGIVADLLAIDANALVDSFEMGGSVEAGSKTDAAKNGFEQGSRRTFAIGAGDVSAGVGALGAAEAVGEDGDIFQIEFGSGRLRGRGEFAAEGEKVADRCVVIHRQDSVQKEKTKADPSVRRLRSG